MQHPSIPHRFQQSITHSRLLEVVTYDPSTGNFCWRIRKNSHAMGVRPGMKVRGTPSPGGYQVIGIDRKRYPAHRLAWFYVHGTWPLGEIDHINRDRLDNRLENLRDTPIRFFQRGNQAPHKDNQSGYKGVSRTRNGKWRARCVRKVVGTFDCPAKAHEAYLAEARKVFGDYASSGA